MSALAGKRVVNTRAVHQAGELDDLLRAHGAVPLAYPCIAIQPPDDTTELDTALADLIAGEFDWLAISSANTVHALAKRLDALFPGRADCQLPLQDGGAADALQCVPTSRRGMGRLQSAPTTIRLAVVGPGTAEAALRELGFRADVMPESYRAVDLAAAMAIAPGERVLLPQSEIAAPDLAEALRARGALVTAVTAYHTIIGSGGVDLPALLTRGEVDAVVFASSSAVEGFAFRLRVAGEGLRDRGQRPGDSSPSTELPKPKTQNLKPGSIDHRPSTIDQLTTHGSRLTTICIGPNTATTARAHGLSPVVPDEQTLVGVILALELELSALSKGLAS